MRQQYEDFDEMDFASAVAQMRQSGAEVCVADTPVPMLWNL